MKAPNPERDRILTDLTGLAASLVSGGVRKDQPDLVLIGRVLNVLVDRVDDPDMEDRIKRFLADAGAGRRAEQQVRDLLKDLGIG